MRITTFILSLLFASFLSPTNVYAQFCKDTEDFQCLENVFIQVIRVAVAGGAIATFLMIVKGGFTWMTSGGEPKQVEAARDSITYGIAGLVIMILIWFILKFIKEFTGVDVTSFEIPK